jgi:pyruvate,water dikinase
MLTQLFTSLQYTLTVASLERLQRIYAILIQESVGGAIGLVAMPTDHPPTCHVIDLVNVGADMAAQVGRKAAGLAEMIRTGENVPSGFCVTIGAQQADVLPAIEIIDAYERLGGGAVAVRSSSTAEDLPHASSAGQHDTVLWVSGPDAVLVAVRRCWRSLHGERAVAYRRANGIGEAAMAVVVQRMIDASVAGVLFTANPVTGCRTEMVVDAAPGLGVAVVDGTVTADHYVLGPDGIESRKGCLTREQLTALHAAGRRLQKHSGDPQDIEWAIDQGGTLWLLQTRPITSLFPAPPASGRPRA